MNLFAVAPKRSQVGLSSITLMVEFIDVVEMYYAEIGISEECLCHYTPKANDNFMPNSDTYLRNRPIESLLVCTPLRM